MADNTLGTTDGDGAAGNGDPGGADLKKSPRNIAGTGDEGGAMVTSSEVESGSLRTEVEPVGLRMKVEPDEVEGTDRTMSDQGGAGGMTEPGGAVKTMVSHGAEGGAKMELID